MTYRKINVEYSNGRFTCNDRRYDDWGDPWDEEAAESEDWDDRCFCPYCDRCFVCVNGKDLDEVRQGWAETLSDVPARIAVLDKMTDAEFKEMVVDAEYVDAPDPYSGLMFSDDYHEVAEMLKGALAGEYDTIYDFGCAGGIQGILFDNVLYVGIDDFYPPTVELPGCDYHVIPAQDYISEHLDEIDQDRSLALCFHVPDEEAREAVINGFDHHFVIYSGEVWDTM